jgi:hypothetical protein
MQTTGETLYNHTLYNPSIPTGFIINPTSGSGYGLYYRSSTPIVNEVRYIPIIVQQLLRKDHEQTIILGVISGLISSTCGYGMISDLTMMEYTLLMSLMEKLYALFLEIAVWKPLQHLAIGSVGPVVARLVFAPSTGAHPSLYYRGLSFMLLMLITVNQV